MAIAHRPATHLTESQIEQFHRDGYLVIRGFYDAGEIETIRQNFTDLHAAGPVPKFFKPLSVEEAGGDPLKIYPRVLHPHRFNDLSMQYMLDARLYPVLEDLFGEEPIAAQSMFYFKPPGAKGQALHQDNMYLRVEPGTCIAAWLAVDDVDAENGGLEVVPGTHAMDLFCPEEADMDQSFTRDYVAPPPGLKAEHVVMKAGDMLFFNGSLVHGSGPNASKDRFRRSFICHYIGRSGERMASYYRPLLDFNGQEMDIDLNEGGGPCGDDVTVTGPH